MSDYFEDGQEFLEHYGVKGMRWGKSGGTASIKGPSTAKLKTKSTVSFKSTKSSAEKTARLKKSGEFATKVALALVISNATSPAIGPVGGVMVGTVGANALVNNLNNRKKIGKSFVDDYKKDYPG